MNSTRRRHQFCCLPAYWSSRPSRGPGHGPVALGSSDARPTTPRPGPEVKEPRMRRHAPRRGAACPGRGWARAQAPVVAWRMTTDQAPVFWPFISAPALPPTGAQMGNPTSSPAVCSTSTRSAGRSPTRRRSPTRTSSSSPSPVANSGTTKALNWMMPFGYRTLVLGDPKDEYEASCRAHGVEPFVIATGHVDPDHPLAKGPLAHGWSRLSAEEGRSAVPRSSSAAG